MVDFMESMRGPLWMNVSGVRKRSPKGLRLELQLGHREVGGWSWDTRSLEHGGSWIPLKSFWRWDFSRSGNITSLLCCMVSCGCPIIAQGQIMFPSQEASHCCHGDGWSHWSMQHMKSLAGIRQWTTVSCEGQMQKGEHWWSRELDTPEGL